MPQPQREPIEAVIFDWGGTLTPWHGDIDHHREWLVYAQAWGADDPVAMATRIESACAQAWARSRTDHTSATVESILADAEIDHLDERHTAALEAHLDFWDEHTYTDPLVAPLWEWLRSTGIRVGVLSNTVWSREHHRSIFERDGVLHLIDADVYSSEIEWSKPHPEAFREAARALGVAPQRCVYVGDRPFEDVHGSKSVGMRSILVPHSDIPVEQQVETDAVPDAVVHDLSEITQHIERWRHG
ncbi:HAD family hydrolase [Yimella sp. cx-573]|nr:HAD family hydrolase [Yimella sp. cx-573]